MKFVNKIIKYLVSFSLILSAFFSVVNFCCFDSNFYYKEYIKFNTAQTISTDDNNLKKITTNLLEYLKDINDDINITYYKNNVETNVYQDIELIHMSDVKELYQSVMFLNKILLIISIICILYLLINKISFSKEFNHTLILCVFAFTLIGISCIIDFDSFWTSFHEIFFTKNDYWLLDPSTCILVNLFNSGFFFDLCFKICLISVFIIIVIFMIINIYEKKAYH